MARKTARRPDDYFYVRQFYAVVYERPAGRRRVCGPASAVLFRSDSDSRNANAVATNHAGSSVLSAGRRTNERDEKLRRRVNKKKCRHPTDGCVENMSVYHGPE